MAERVKGMAGVFIYSGDSDRLTWWYREHLGIESQNEATGGVSYHEFFSKRIDEERTSRLSWSIFPRDFPGSHGARVVYHVDDLDVIIAQLAAAAGVRPLVTEDFDYGRFAYIQDPDGNVVGLFQDLELQV